MVCQTVRLNVTLPKDIVRLVDQMCGARKRSSFIAEAIALKIEQIEREKLEKDLTEGYRMCHRESLDMASEFASADLEGWDDY